MPKQTHKSITRGEKLITEDESDESNRNIISLSHSDASESTNAYELETQHSPVKSDIEENLLNKPCAQNIELKQSKYVDLDSIEPVSVIESETESVPVLESESVSESDSESVSDIESDLESIDFNVAKKDHVKIQAIVPKQQSNQKQNETMDEFSCSEYESNSIIDISSSSSDTDSQKSVSFQRKSKYSR